MAVMAIACSTGKYRKKTGVSNVPNPNPEKKVRIAAEKAMIGSRMISTNKQCFVTVV